MKTMLLVAGLLFSGCASGKKANVNSGASEVVIMPEPATIVLFDGTSWGKGDKGGALGAWGGWMQEDGQPSTWAIQPDGSVIVGPGDAITSIEFSDFHLHIEFLCPKTDGAEGQARSNSGVYLHGRYEVQVLDSFGDEPVLNGCGAVYAIAPPLMNASLPAGQWQTYDIMFRAPRFGLRDQVTDLPRVTVIHNGVVIHNNRELPSTTRGGIDEEMRASGPILLQDHGDPVQYRNIWIRELE